MPIFRINDKLHYFAHVPKCGGSSVESYLTDRFGPLALDEKDRHLVPETALWTRSATQHVPVLALDRLIPPDWFASSFAVVRHPVCRLMSAFFYARDAVSLIPLSAEFNAWFSDAASAIETRPFRYGGHLLPQSALVPEGSRVFRFEDGLDEIVPYLDGLAGNSDGPRTMPSRNVGRWRREEAVPVPTADTLALIGRVYAEDFARFGYALPTAPAEAAGLAALPSQAATGAPPEPRPRRFMRRLQRSLMKRAGM